MQQRLLAGAAAATITPPLGTSLAGLYRDRRATSILSDLSAKALVLGNGSSDVAIVVVDLCYVPADLADRARSRAESLTGIPAERVMLTCTHTHSGPVTVPSAWSEPDQSYLDVLVRRIGDAVCLAKQRQQEARLLVGHGTEETIAFNRRYWMADGTVRTNPRYQSPDLVKPAGPIDPEVGVIRVEAATGAPIALLVNFPLHVAVLASTAISADYPGVLSDFFRKLEGPDLVVLFATGCCGDVNHCDFSKPGPQGGQPFVERIGTALAGEVTKVTTRLTPLTDASRIGFAQKVVELPLRVPTADDIVWAEARRDAEMQSMDAAGLAVVKAHRILRIRQHGWPTVTAMVQVMAVGDLAYVTLPGEIFVELGLGIKKRSPFPHTFVAELNGTAFGYIPTEKAYGEGGYEATSSLLMPGSGERLVETALELLEVVR
ncbi:MAG TPA: hypothetical protein VNL16_00440 [Chloroflexota bacterium]|nr:hypothetical protein [Chloroflexota bacterium]